MLQHLPSMPHKEQPEVNPLTVLQLGLAQTMKRLMDKMRLSAVSKKMVKKRIVHVCMSLLYISGANCEIP